MDNNTRFIVILICGVPGVGKTYLTNKLNSKLNTIDTKTVPIIFDQIFIQSFDNKEKFDLLKFKESRIKFFEKFRLVVNDMIDNSKQTNIIILDDNFYFKSMRKPFYKFVLNHIEKLHISYIEIHLKCELNYAISNNNKRNSLEKVPEEIIIKISNHFQYDSFHKKLIHTLNIHDFQSLNDTDELEKVIISKIDFNYELLKKFVEKAKDCLKIDKITLKTKFIEKLEICFRKNIGEILKTNPNLKKFSFEISNRKTEFLDFIKYLLKNKNSKNFDQSKYENFEIQNNLNLEIIIDQLKSDNYNINFISKLIEYFNLLVHKKF